jgi:phosphoribosylformylglycinamidine cyclo-ligase
MAPTTIYVKPILELLGKHDIHGMAHITGGGLPGNLVRALPVGTRAVLERRAIPVLPIFELVRERGRVGRAEMDRTFNCGVGFTVIVKAAEAAAASAFLKKRGVANRPIGSIEKGRRGVLYSEA